VVVVTAAGFAGWRLLGTKPHPVQVAQTAPAAAPASAQASTPAPAAPAAPAPVAIEIPVPPRQDEASATVTAPAPAPAVSEPVAQGDKPAAQELFGQTVAAAPAAADQDLKPRTAPTAKVLKPAAPRTAAALPAAPAASTAAKMKDGRVETPAQRAENSYRRALASLEDGRVLEAIAGLQAALQADPRHEAARQTLVSLLIEAKRPDEALRQLGTALALDPRQPAMAMLMARLQIERGSSGIDTLLRTLPYAAGDGEYHGFLAGALAREARHREAIEHFQAALRTAPQNGVWWMGLGISLQAEKRNPEAAGAFQKALDSGVLSAQLQGFVQRKLKELAR
jgi:MSHA biogenesis protein MshN